MMKSFSFAVALLVARTFPAISSSCTGSTPDWMDADGYGCEWYEAYDMPGCPRYGNLYEGDMGLANSNCCYCEGTGEPSSTCTGSTPNWVDLFGDGCEWYETYDTPGCPRYGNLYEGDMGLARDNCCYCEDTTRAPSYYPSSYYYPSYVPIEVPAAVGTNAPTIPSSTPDGASYYQSFEVGTLPFADDEGDPIWSTTNLDAPTLIWEETDEEAATGIYSLKNPILNNEPKVPSQTNLTLIMPDQGSGALHFSVLAGNQMPFDQFEYSVDGVSRGFINDPRTEWEELVLQVGPGAHIFDFVYKFNLQNIPALGLPPPEAFPERTGLVYVDDVYFVPSGTSTRAPSSYPHFIFPYVPTGAPTAGDTTTVSPDGQEPTRAPSYYPSYVPTGAASIPSSIPTRSNGTSSGGPTIIPAGAVYYDGFERATFWSTNHGDGVWELTTERAASGIYSIKSPDLSSESYTPSSSNVTLSFLDPDFEGGTLILSVMPGIVEPFDNLEYFVNGNLSGVLSAPKEDGEFEILEISLQEGPQEITFQYNYNPYSLDTLPPSPPDMIGTVYIDDVYIEPIAGEVPADLFE